MCVCVGERGSYLYRDVCVQGRGGSYLYRDVCVCV